MTDELKDQRIPIMMTPSEVKAVDDWMFQNRIRSRGGAIRSLVNRGLMFDVALDAIGAGNEFITALHEHKATKDMMFDYYYKLQKCFDTIKAATDANNAVIEQIEKIKSEYESAVENLDSTDTDNK